MIRGDTKNLADEINEEIKAKCDAYAAAAVETDEGVQKGISGYRRNGNGVERA